MDFYNNLGTIKYISEHSDFVTINRKKAKEFAQTFRGRKEGRWLSASPFDFSHFSDEKKLNFLLSFDSFSFCYWGDPKWTVEYNDKQFEGSWAMMTSLQRALDEGKPLLDASYRSKISFEEFSDIFRGNVVIPLLEDRYKIFKQIAGVLEEKYGGDFTNFVKKYNHDVITFLQTLIKDFP